MIREDAIKWIRLDIDMAKFDPSTGEEAYLNDDARHVIEAQEMAIKALEQPEIIRCKDCIWKNKHNCTRAVEVWIDDDKFCAWAERRLK